MSFLPNSPLDVDTIKQMVVHHDWIHGRFELTENYKAVAYYKILKVLTRLSDRQYKLHSMSLATMQDPPIICAWIDTPTLLDRHSEEYKRMEYVLNQIGYNVDFWWNKDDNTFRISLRANLPFDFIEILRHLDEEWYTKRLEAQV